MKLLGDLKYRAFCFNNSMDWKSCFRILLSCGTSANVLYRISKGFQNIGLGIVSLILCEINRFFNGCIIGCNAEFDEGFVLLHPMGVVINGAVKGGRNIVIESSVVIGVASYGLPVKAPVIGNNVYFGSGAKVLGGIRIGSNVKIGANAVVINNVPDGATVVGVPARVIAKIIKDDQ
jgi:serine O-acetyltransferase